MIAIYKKLCYNEKSEFLKLLMETTMKKTLLVTVFCLILALLIVPFALHAEAEETEDTITILFTHDLHSHFLPINTKNGESGGYARLYTLLQNERNAAKGATVTLDAGDFAMGSFFQTIYATDAAELRILSDLGYDATTLGNHEFDFRQSGLVNMLNNAVTKGGNKRVPIVLGNYYPPTEATEVWDAYNNYGIKDYTVIEKEGVRFAVFGLIGADAHSNAPMSGMVFEDPIERAKEIIEEIKAKEDYDYIICLSHSGTSQNEDESEDHALAKAVDGIDVIVSGHTHSTISEPIHVNNTWIVSAGSYAENLGVIKLNGSHGATELFSYELKPVDESVASDPAISQIVENYKATVSESYLKNYGLTYDQVIAYSPYNFASTGGAQIDKALGNLISDAYRYAVEQVEGEDGEYVTFTLNASGVIRGTFSKGNITTADVFHVLSLGVGADGTPGYPLISVYVTGKDLKDALEVDASVVPLMSAAQLYGNGLYWKYNTNRMIFNKIVECGVTLPDGSQVPLEDDKLYRVVTGLYCGQMLSAVEAKSFGLLSVTPRDKNGDPVTDYDALIIHDKDGNEVKEWYALASYMQSFEKNDNLVSVIPATYAEAANRKVVYASWSPYELLRNANWITLLVLAIVLIVIALLVLLTVKITKSILRKKKQ